LQFPLAGQVIDDLLEVGVTRVAAGWPYEEVAARADLEVARPPGRDIIDIADFVAMRFVHGSVPSGGLIHCARHTCRKSNPQSGHSRVRAWDDARRRAAPH